MLNKKNFYNLLINNQTFHILTLYIIFFCLILFLNGQLSVSEQNIKHFSTYFRDDIVFVYNSLLYSEGLEVHHLDHPSLFTYFIFPIFYKFFNFLGFISFDDLKGFLKSENIDISLSKLFFISRFAIQIISLGTIFLFYKISEKYSKDKLISFLITILFIFSIGFTSASNRIESGLISMFLALISFYFLIKFYETLNKKGLKYFCLVFLFIFSSMMQKKIIFFLIPFLFLSSIFLIKKNSIEYFKYKFLNINSLYKFLLFLIYLAVFSFISLKTIINNTFFLPRDLDFIFLTISYFGLNLILFYFIKFFQNKNYSNLLTYNIVIGSTYFVYKYLLIYLLSAPVAVWSISFTNFMGQLNMFIASEEIKEVYEFSNLSIYIEKLLSNFNLVINKYIISYSYQSILLWANLLLFFLNYKKSNLIKLISILFLLFGFLLIQSILLFRYEQDTYYLNSEILLLLALSLNFSFEYKKIQSAIILIFIFIFTLSPVSEKLIFLKNQNSKSYCNNLDYRFYEYYTNKIPNDVIGKLCISYNDLK